MRNCIAVMLLLVTSPVTAQIPANQPLGEKLEWKSADGRALSAWFGRLDAGTQSVVLLTETTVPLDRLDEDTRDLVVQCHRDSKKQAAMVEALQKENKSLRKQVSDYQQENKSTAPPLNASADSASDAKSEIRLVPVGAVAEFGQYVTDGRVAIRITHASVEKIAITNPIGTQSRSKEPALKITMEIENLDDRKIVTFDPGNMFGASRFSLRDDVDNVIRGVSYGGMSFPVGTLSKTDDLAPEEMASHVEVFTAPPKATKHLILSVDLVAFGGKGNAKFKIEANKITGL